MSCRDPLCQQYVQIHFSQLRWMFQTCWLLLPLHGATNLSPSSRTLTAIIRQWERRHTPSLKQSQRGEIFTWCRLSTSYDQRLVVFMCDIHHRSKVKNDKIQRWWISLSCYGVDVVYLREKENSSGDTLLGTVVLPLVSQKDSHEPLSL